MKQRKRILLALAAACTTTVPLAKALGTAPHGLKSRMQDEAATMRSIIAARGIRLE